MTKNPTELAPNSVVSFRDARWETRWLVVGLIVLVFWHSIAFVDRQWFAGIPPWLFLILTSLLPQIFLLLFPIITRTPRRRSTFGFPAPTRCLIEFAIAIPVVIVTVVVLAVANYLVGRFSPGTSLTPDAINTMAASPTPILTYLALLFSFTFAPVAEEVFFRGFLQSAFRARMPWIIASLGQCLIFGFAHFFGVMHAGVAFLVGLLLTLLYEWRGTLLAPILAHAGINLIGALGVVVMMAAHADSAVLGVRGDPDDTACVIRIVKPGSAADKVGIEVGDVVTSFDGQPIRDFPHLAEAVRRHRAGDTVTMTVIRAGSAYELDVVLGRRPQP